MTNSPNFPKSFVQSVKDLLGSSGWTVDPSDLDFAATPWRGNYKGHTQLIAKPASTEEVSELVKLCFQNHIPVTPQGGNTGLVDAGIPHGDLCMSLGRLNRIRETDELNNSLISDSGVTLFDVQEAAKRMDRYFPLSLASQGTATIGGLVSTNAGGVAVLRYGMMRDLILGLEVVLPTGEIWNGLSGLRKNNTGYDLKHLFAGAEGTLGIITAANLKLFPRVSTASAWVSCSSLDDIVAMLSLVRGNVGDTVTGFEMIPAKAVSMVLGHVPSVRDPNPSTLPWRILIEVSMMEESQAQESLIASLEIALEKNLAKDVLVAHNLAQAQMFWNIRESISPAKRAYGTAVNHDISVPVSQIATFIEKAEQAVNRIVPTAEIVVFGHVGDGNLHYSVCEPLPPSQSKLEESRAEVTRAVHETVISFEGSISAEHGVGRMKRDELVELRPRVATHLMQSIKRAIDPTNIMNPNRVIPSDSIEIC